MILLSHLETILGSLSLIVKSGRTFIQDPIFNLVGRLAGGSDFNRLSSDRQSFSPTTSANTLMERMGV
jgi:hypothetical protein